MGYTSPQAPSKLPSNVSQPAAATTVDSLRARAAAYRTAHPARQHPAAPEDTGQRLATWPRGEGTELRVSWQTYEGHPYLSLRVWKQGEGGGWWPVKDRSLTVKVRELADLAEAVAAALDLAQQREAP